jgi:hypothetical protein
MEKLGTIRYKYNTKLDLTDEQTKERLEQIEKKIANIFIDEVFKEGRVVNIDLIRVIFAKIIATADDRNEMLQGICDAIVVNSISSGFDEYSCQIIQNNGYEEWVIEGRDVAK